LLTAIMVMAGFLIGKNGYRAQNAGCQHASNGFHDAPRIRACKKNCGSHAAAILAWGVRAAQPG